MKRWNLNLIMLSICCLFLMGCANNALPEVSTDLSQEMIGGVKIGQSVNAEPFVEKYGDKEKLPKSPVQHDEKDVYQLNEGFELAVEKSGEKIVMLQVYHPSELTTQKGIHVGSPIRDVTSAYGPSYSERNEQGMPIIAYADLANGTYIQFWLYEEKVQSIWYGEIDDAE